MNRNGRWPRSIRVNILRPLHRTKNAFVQRFVRTVKVAEREKEKKKKRRKINLEKDRNL